MLVQWAWAAERGLNHVECHCFTPSNTITAPRTIFRTPPAVDPPPVVANPAVFAMTVTTVAVTTMPTTQPTRNPADAAPIGCLEIDNSDD